MPTGRDEVRAHRRTGDQYGQFRFQHRQLVQGVTHAFRRHGHGAGGAGGGQRGSVGTVQCHPATHPGNRVQDDTDARATCNARPGPRPLCR